MRMERIRWLEMLHKLLDMENSMKKQPQPHNYSVDGMRDRSKKNRTRSTFVFFMVFFKLECKTLNIHALDASY